MLISWMEADERYRAGLKAELRSAVPMRGDLLKVWLGRPVAFIHLEKTAGMSVASFLTTRFHPLQIDPDPNRVFPPHVLTSFPPHVAEQARRYPLVWGHYDLPSLRRLGADRFVFTFLQEPKARILSLHWYWRSHGPLDMGRDGSNQPVLAAQSLSLIDFLRCEDPAVRNHTDGFYVRRLTGLYQTDWDGDPLLADPEGCLRAALDALASMDFVGITEDVAGSMAALGSKLGFEPPPRMPRVNVTRRRGGDASDGQELLGPVNPSVATELAWLTRSDQVIYTAAARRHRRNV